jgi:hypothetical protein
MDIQTLTIVNADWLPDALLSRVWKFAQELRLTLLLQPSNASDERIWSFAERRGADTVDEASLAHLLGPRPTRQPATLAGPAESLTVDDVPDSGVLRFRHDARALLPDDQFAVFDEQYRRAYTAAHGICWTPNDVTMLLTGLWGWCATPTDAIVAARAVQAAALTAGYLLHINLDQVRHHITCHGNVALTARHYQRLWGSFAPETAFVVAAYDAGHSISEITSIRLADVHAAADGSLLGRVVHPAAQPFLTVLAHTSSDRPSSGLVMHSKRAIRDTLVHAGYTYRLPLHVAPLRADADTHHSDYRGAVTLEAIA